MDKEISTKIIWTNGCFDILHRGHIEMLQYAASLGHKLYVGIDADEKVRRDKGPRRPFNGQEDRKYLLESIRGVDKVLIFNTREMLNEMIKNIKPDVLVVGSDWKRKTVIGSEFATEVKFFDRIIGYSTTKVLEVHK